MTVGSETNDAPPAIVPLLWGSGLLVTKARNSPSLVGITNWRHISGYAIRRGLAGLILRGADNLGLEIPADVRLKLSQSSSRVAAENLHALHETERILRVFNDQGIPVMLLKGAALQRTLYPTPDLRPMSDVDLLVRVHDANRALRLLDEFGCRRGHALLRDDFFPTFHYETELIIPSTRPVRLDLHARPFRPLRLSRIIPDDAFWTDAFPVSIGEALVLLPSSETNFIHLAAHAAFHGFSRLIWLYDIHRLVEQNNEGMNWDRVAENCEKWRLSLPVLRAAERTTRTFGTSIPTTLMRKLSKQRISWADRWTLHQAPRDAASPIMHVLRNLMGTPGIRFRLAYLASILTPDNRHLGELYRPRHFGWPVVAHGCRVLRACARLVTAAVRSIAPIPAR